MKKFWKREYQESYPINQNVKVRRRRSWFSRLLDDLFGPR